jgi:hypothetical protein
MSVLMDGHAPSPAAEHIGTAEHYRWLHGIVMVVLLLNLFDALFTLYWVRSGHATEANHLLAELVEKHAVVFVAVKTSLVSAGSWLLWHKRDRAFAVISIFVVFLAYYVVLLMHLQYTALLVRFLLGVDQV